MAESLNLMKALPSIKTPLQHLVLFLPPPEDNLEDSYFWLELSASRNLMILQFRLGKKDLMFECIISLQKEILSTSVHPCRATARQQCCTAALKALKKTQPVIYVKSEPTGKQLDTTMLMAEAHRQQVTGRTPARIPTKIHDCTEIVVGENDNTSKILEEFYLNPWEQYMVSALYLFLDEFYQKMTLEDVILDLKHIPQTLWNILLSACILMQLKPVRHGSTVVLEHRFTAEDIVGILQLNGGESGRYKMASLRSPLSEQELAIFQDLWLEKHQQLVKKRSEDK